MSQSDPPSLSATQRSAGIEKAMDKLAQLRAKRKFLDALHQRNGPVNQTRDLPLGSKVLVWRIHSKAWMGPYELISVSDEECVVQVNNKAVLFRSTVVRPYYEDPDDSQDNRDDPSDPISQPSEPGGQAPPPDHDHSPPETPTSPLSTLPPSSPPPRPYVEDCDDEEDNEQGDMGYQDPYRDNAFRASSPD